MTSTARFLPWLLVGALTACGVPSMETDATDVTRDASPSDTQVPDVTDTVTPMDVIVDVPVTADVLDVFDASDGIDMDVADAPQGDGDAMADASGDAMADADASVDVVCVGTLASLTLPPRDLFVMFDQSGSMTEDVAGGGTKWDGAVAAFNSFVSSPAAGGLSVGLQYFPLDASSGSCPAGCVSDPDCGTGGPCFFGMCACALGAADSCDASDYSVAAVEIAALPGASSALATSLAAHAPTNSTPTGPALSGAIAHAHDWATAHPGDRVAVVLVTDGEPNECTPGDIPGVASIAASGFAGMPSVPTYVVSLGVTTLDPIAAAGGTDHAFFIPTTTEYRTQIQTALETVRTRERSCALAVPPDAGGGVVDPSRVNVIFTASGSTPATVDHVADATACPATGDAWYWDTTGANPRIAMCTAFCARPYDDAGSTLQVQIGCATHDLTP